jgi:6-hydroxycyclohex-1-ene-1-carbonyl-CoA dehydrogenase
VSQRAWRKTTSSGTLQELSLADAAPGDGRVLVAVEGAALDPWSATPEGRVPGLAAVGRVIATGDAAHEWFGARVLVPTLAPCGECDRCRRGGAALCPDGAAHGSDGPGALATVVTAAARWLVRLEAPLDIAGPAVAALGGELALAYALYARAGVGPREPAIVWGRGAIARAAAVMLAAKGAPAAVVTEAEAATAALAEHDPRRPRKVLVTDATLLPLALASAGPRATVVVLTAPGFAKAPAVELGAILAEEIVVTGVRGCHPDLVPELVALAVRGELDLGALVEVVTLDELAARMAELGMAEVRDRSLVATVGS